MQPPPSRTSIRFIRSLTGLLCSRASPGFHTNTAYQIIGFQEFNNGPMVLFTLYCQVPPIWPAGAISLGVSNCGSLPEGMLNSAHLDIVDKVMIDGEEC